MKKHLPPYVYPKGKRGYLYFTRGGQTTRMQAQPGTPEFAAEYALLLRGRAPVPPGKTYRALIASYRKDHRFSRLTPRTKADYDKVLTFIADRLGDHDPTKTRHWTIVEWQRENAGAIRFANYLVQILSILFKHAKRLGWREDNPAEGVEMLKSAAPRREAWPADKVEAYRAKATGPALLIFELCLGTGQRIGDVLRMRWNDIDGGRIHVKQGKTGNEAWGPITSHLRAALDATPKRGLTLVTNPDGRPMAYKTAQGHVMRARKLAGCEGHDIHALRHTTAQYLAGLGFTDEEIMSVTGHTNTVTLRRYTASARQNARSAAVTARVNRTGPERDS